MYWQSLESKSQDSEWSRVTGLSRHRPILVDEVLEGLQCAPQKNYLDLTLGGGGHGLAILEKTSPTGILIGADRDLKALQYASQKLKAYGTRFRPEHSDAKDVSKLLKKYQDVPIHGALMDCGVSSDQLEEADRGFSFQMEGPLDMRMDESDGFTAYEWLSASDEEDIADTIFELGEERYSRRIARGIVEARKMGKLKTTLDLARICVQAYPPSARHGKIHPATRTFQAVRMLVNAELDQIHRAISGLIEGLPEGARIAVITFHSLEDRLVKNAFRSAKEVGKAIKINKKPTPPSEREIKSNPRARSAHLRVAEVVRGVG